MSDAMSKINALTEEQRARALDVARRRIAGDEPQAEREPALSDYLGGGDTRYPPFVTRTIYFLSGIMLISAFLPSAMRLHEVGLTAFGYSVADTASKHVAALCIVLMAEIGQVIFSLAVINAENRLWRVGLLIGALICTIIALSGNAVANEAHALDDVFAFLETFAPPVLVLITAQVLKSQMLRAIAARHEAKQLFEAAHAQWKADYAAALSAWQAAYQNAPHAEMWMHHAANALRDALRAANRRSPAVLRELTDADWRALILRELSAEYWYERAERSARETEERQRQAEAARALEVRRATADRNPMRAGGEHTGELEGAVQRREDGSYGGTCPYCGQVFVHEHAESAMKALAAHVGRWCPVRNNAQETAMRSALRSAQMIEARENNTEREGERLS